MWEGIVVVELSYKEESWRLANREVPAAQVVRALARNAGDLGSTPGGAFIFASAPSLYITITTRLRLFSRVNY